jgi:hypothetical protein
MIRINRSEIPFLQQDQDQQQQQQQQRNRDDLMMINFCAAN